MLKLIGAVLYKLGQAHCRTGKPPVFKGKQYLAGYSNQYEREQKLTAMSEVQNV